MLTWCYIKEYKIQGFKKQEHYKNWEKDARGNLIFLPLKYPLKK